MKPFLFFSLLLANSNSRRHRNNFICSGDTALFAFYRAIERFGYVPKHQDFIIFNSKVVVSKIPEKAYEYMVNRKSAIEWIMERYQVKIDKKSGIKNDPNDWEEEVGNPRYILSLLPSVINVGVQTVEIVEGLPRLEFEMTN